MAPSMFGTWAEKVDVEPTGNISLGMMKGDLASLSTLFQDTKNPAAAWLCWYLAQKWQMPAPQPVADAINRFAEQIANLAIQALDGNAETVINADVVGALWDTSPKKAKGKTRRGLTGLAEQLFLSERDFSIAFRVHELRERAGLTEDKAVEKFIEEINDIEKDKKKTAKGKKAKKRKPKSEKAKSKMAMNRRLKIEVNDDDAVYSFDNVKRIAKKYRNDFNQAEIEARAEANYQINTCTRKKKRRVTRRTT